MMHKWSEQKYIYKKWKKKERKTSVPPSTLFKGVYEKHNLMIYADVILHVHKETITVITQGKSNVSYM